MHHSPLTKFTGQRRVMDQNSTLYIFEKLFQLLHADIADLRFLAKSAVDPKYCLLFLGLPLPKIYTYPMKNRSLLARKIKIFYDDVSKKRKGEKMQLQTDQKLLWNEI